MNMQNYKDIDEYIAACPSASTQERLKKIRATIRNAVPEAKEKISYGIPTFTLNGKNIVHFGGYDTHIGFYPGAVGVDKFREELKPYDTSKGTVRFPFDQPIPYDLIAKITKKLTDQERTQKT